MGEGENTHADDGDKVVAVDDAIAVGVEKVKGLHQLLAFLAAVLLDLQARGLPVRLLRGACKRPLPK
jgi:hypothetical protein